MLLNISLFIHVVCVIFWVGGMLFLSLVIGPYVRTLEDFSAKAQIYKMVGARYRFWSWIAIGLIITTGLLNMYLMGFPPSLILNPPFHGTPFGRPVMVKLGLLTILLSLSIYHDFVLGPKSRGSAEYAKKAKFFGRTNLILALLIILVAVMLRTGGF